MYICECVRVACVYMCICVFIKMCVHICVCAASLCETVSEALQRLMDEHVLPLACLNSNLDSNFRRVYLWREEVSVSVRVKCQRLGFTWIVCAKG